MNGYISIGEASRITGLPTKTIRFYEEINLISPAKRLENSYRSYSKEDLDVLFLIKETKALGLPLKDVREVVHICVSQGCKSANEFLKAKVPGYLKEIESKISELKDLEKRLLEYKQRTVDPDKPVCAICTGCDEKEVKGYVP
jgi:MerR family transcriptional regulator, copper efflux regulator